MDQVRRREAVQREAIEHENSRLQGELKAVQKTGASRQSALQEALAIGEYVDRGEREAVLEKVKAVNRDHLSPLEVRYLDETAQRFRTELSMRSFQEGMEHERTKRYGDAVQAFQKSLDLVAEGEQTNRVRLHLANALRLQGKQTEAVTVLRELLDSDLLDRDLAAESRWNLALCFAETHMRDAARRELLHVITKFPTSQWARAARTKLAEVNQMR
jgi:TolA-binding protein